MRSSYIWAVIIMIAIGGWLASGQVIVGGQGDKALPDEQGQSADGSPSDGSDAAAGEETKPFRVRVRTMSAIDRTAELSIRGRTEADKRVTLRAQTSGLVESIEVRKGQPVKAGDIICKLEAGSREAHVLHAQAGLDEAFLIHDAATKLSEKGYAAETRVRAAKAGLDAAKATLKVAELDMDRTNIRTLFDGLIDDILPKTGSLLSVGDVCAEVVAADPMLVVAQVSERDIGRLKTGMKGTAHLVTGDTADGLIRYLAPSAEESTRTFRIELAVPNADGRLRDGVTAEITIPLETTKAHRFSPAVLTLNDKGEIGVRTIDESNTVDFQPVKILGNEDGQIWVSGLPDTVTLITVGQEYVSIGAVVDPVFETAQNAAPVHQASADDSAATASGETAQ